jgi:hypothetical protein
LPGSLGPKYQPYKIDGAFLYGPPYRRGPDRAGEPCATSALPIRGKTGVVGLPHFAKLAEIEFRARHIPDLARGKFGPCSGR